MSALTPSPVRSFREPCPECDGAHEWHENAAPTFWNDGVGEGPAVTCPRCAKDGTVERLVARIGDRWYGCLRDVDGAEMEFYGEPFILYLTEEDAAAGLWLDTVNPWMEEPALVGALNAAFGTSYRSRLDRMADPRCIFCGRERQAYRERQRNNRESRSAQTNGA